MRKRVYRHKAEPDLSHAGLGDTEAEHEAIRQDRDCYAPHSWRAPDPLSILLAAESGRPILYPLFPLNAFKPTPQCNHAVRPIAKGSSACCMDCHDTGLRDHPALKLFPGDIPKLDETEAITPTADRERTEELGAILVGSLPKETRKQRRARLHAERANDVA